MCNFQLQHIHNEKAWNSPRTRQKHRGSSIALIIMTSNAEAHALMYICTTIPDKSQRWQSETLVCHIHTHGHLPLPCCPIIS